MIALMNELTDMPNWERKIFDPNFTFKWKSAQLMNGRDVTRSMADWVRLLYGCIELDHGSLIRFSVSKR